MLNSTVHGQDMMEQIRLKQDELEQIIHRALQPEVDYMVLDNHRFCLLKAGAEKLCDYYGYRVQYQLVQSSSSHVNEQAMYIVKASLVSWQTGEVIAEGLGLASSQESRYENQNSMDVANTVLKIAKKRAMVDAVITAVGGSFLLTQDLEDMQSGNFQQKTGSRGGFQSNNRGNSQPQQNSYQKKQDNGYGKSGSRNYGGQGKSGKPGYGSGGGNKNASKSCELATENQISYIEQLVSKLRINRQQLTAMLKESFDTMDYRSLNKQQASDFIQQLREQNTQAS